MDRSDGTQSLLSFLPRIEILGYDIGRGAASLILFINFIMQNLVVSIQEQPIILDLPVVIVFNLNTAILEEPTPLKILFYQVIGPEPAFRGKVLRFLLIYYCISPPTIFFLFLSFQNPIRPKTKIHTGQIVTNKTKISRPASKPLETAFQSRVPKLVFPPA